MKVFLGIFPTWLRYFVQPFLVLYYVPLFVLRGLAGPARATAQRKHEFFLESWKQAVNEADQLTSGWPLHVQDGVFEKDFDELDVNDAVAEAVEISFEAKEEKANGRNFR
jgi:hypothetical protein